MITLTVNGEEKKMDDAISMTVLLQSLSIDVELVVVEYNNKVADKASFDKLFCQDQDQIEIVQFMGGG